MTKRQSADVIVVGSGAGGSTVAGGLAREGFRVILIEAGPQTTAPIGTHARNSEPGEAGTDAFASVLDRQLIFPSHADRAIPGLPGYKVAHGIGGMFAMWTNNCPRPHRDELPVWSKAGDWEAYLDR